MKDVINEKYSLLFGDCLERMKEIPDNEKEEAMFKKQMLS